VSNEAPMTPADCDLRGLEWMPLYGGRLFGSDFDAHASDAEWRAALQLWWAAWNQVPAASLPDDDVALCRLAGFGRDVKAWRKVKERALYGFTICTDGRYYHKALAVFALESWQRRLRDRERKAKYRAEKERRAAGDGTRTETGTGRGNEVGQPRSGTADEMRCDETGQDATLKEDLGGKPPKATRKTKLPADWKPTDEQLAYAKGQGCTDPADTAERFRLHHQSKGTLGQDWNLGFQYWCRNEKTFRKATPEDRGEKRAREIQQAIENSREPLQ